jgi:hypothetical protein
MSKKKNWKIKKISMIIIKKRIKIIKNNNWMDSNRKLKIKKKKVTTNNKGFLLLKK